MYRDQRVADSVPTMGNSPIEIARLNTKIMSIKVSLKGLMMWGGLILLISGPLSAVTVLWWLVLIFGVALPLAVGVGSRISGFPQAHAALHAANHGEKELLKALEVRGELTPAHAALETSLNTSEADRILSELASKGYLGVRVDGTKISYSLW
ncbi:MAG: hypothetical protein WA990_11415 [Rubrobacteraceae bacterium]